MTNTCSAAHTPQLFREKLEEGDKLYDSGQYSKAFEVYGMLHNQLTAFIDISSSQVIELYYKCGTTCLKKGDNPAALKYLTKGLDTLKVNKMEKSLETAKIFNLLGKVYLVQAKTIEAHDYFYNALDILLKDFSHEYNEIIISYNNIADYFLYKDRFSDALEYLQEAIKLISTNGLKTTIDHAFIYLSLGAISRNLAKYCESFGYARKSLDIMKEIYQGQEHPNFALYYNHVGNIYLEQGKFKEALENFNLGLSIREKFLGEDHPLVAASYNNIAIMQHNTEQFDLALENYAKCLKIELAYYEKDHPEVASTYANIASVLCAQKQLEKALDYALTALNIRLGAYGENNLQVAASYNDIGFIYKKLENFDKAQIYLTKALKIYFKFFGDKNPTTIGCHFDLALLSFQVKDFDNSLKHFMNVVKNQTLLFEHGHPEMIRSLYNMGNIFKLHKDDVSHQAYTRKVLLLLKEYDGKGYRTEATISRLKEIEMKSMGDSLNSNLFA